MFARMSGVHITQRMYCYHYTTLLLLCFAHTSALALECQHQNALRGLSLLLDIDNGLASHSNGCFARAGSGNATYCIVHARWIRQLLTSFDY